MTDSLQLTMIDTDKIAHLALSDATTLETLREMARDMQVALYRRYTKSEAVKILNISQSELEGLRSRGQIAYLLIGKKNVGFLGCQLLTYLLECVVPVGASPKPSEASSSEPAKPTVSPAAELISVKDTLVMLGIGRTKLYELLNANEIESVKIGKRTLIKQASLRRFIDVQAD